MEVLKVGIVLALIGVGSMVPCHAQNRPLTDAEKKIIASAYGSGLKDPQSAQYRWADLVVDPSFKGAEFGYCFQVNAKNSYGGYTGFRIIGGKVTRRNGTIVAYSYISGGSRDEGVMAEATSNICKMMGYTF